MAFLSLEDRRALEIVIESIQHGGVVAFPTDTVYGLGASLNHRNALARIYDIKQRSHDKPLPILVSSPTVIADLTDNPDKDVLQLASHFWPGPLTLILEAKPGLPPEVTAPDGTLGVRVPDHSIALAIAQHNGGAIATTSANASGQPPTLHAKDILDVLGNAVDIILDGGIAPGGLASTVIRREGDTITLVREGAIHEATIQHAWSSIRPDTRPVTVDTMDSTTSGS